MTESTNDRISDDFGTPECVKKMWRLVAEQCLLLGETVGILRSNPPADFPLAHLMFNAVLDSGHSYMLLLENSKIRDCFPLARCILETTVNACFIAATGQVTEDQAIKHAVQKAHREKSRQFKFRHSPLKVGWPYGPIVPTDPMAAAALAEYTSKKGREITSWTSDALEERIERIETWLGKQTGDRLRFSLFSIYRFSSEVAHGTLYSILQFMGTWDIPLKIRSDTALALHHGGLITELSLHVVGSLNTSIRAGCRLSGDNGNASVADDLFKAITEMKWAQNLKIGPDGVIRKANEP